jgi:hypothetical protein
VFPVIVIAIAQTEEKFRLVDGILNAGKHSHGTLRNEKRWTYDSPQSK